jgi:S-adenosylmethionine synthetase
MIIIEPSQGQSAAEELVEIVERKGTGHPDFICDSIMEAISVALSNAYLREWGSILHHNIDKGLLVAGQVDLQFGGGSRRQPMELIIGDRATCTAAGRTLPIADLAVAAAQDWIRRNLRFVDAAADVRYRVVLAPGSAELSDIFSRTGPIHVANDTSAAVGYYPLSPTEQVVLRLERHLNSPSFKAEFPYSGEDVKVMALRHGSNLDLTVAMPLIARYINSEQDYFMAKEVLQRAMELFLDDIAGFRKIAVHYNTLDEPARGLGGIYLSLTGTSAEDADSGQVGRGNRVNGLISLNRPMGTEAAAGKNPVSHVGKIYTVLAHKIARQIYETVGGVQEVYVLLLSRIGSPIDRPQMATARILPEQGRNVRDMEREIRGIFEKELAEIGSFCQALARGDYPMC